MIIELAGRIDDILVTTCIDELLGVVQVMVVDDEVQVGFSSNRIISDGRVISIVVTLG